MQDGLKDKQNYLFEDQDFTLVVIDNDKRNSTGTRRGMNPATYSRWIKSQTELFLRIKTLFRYSLMKSKFRIKTLLLSSLMRIKEIVLVQEEE